MKLKSLFLCMLGAAVFVGCNNEIDGPDNGQKGPDDVVEGLPIYASMSLKLSSGAKSYAGSSDIVSSAQELNVRDAALYIYKSDASGMTPQCAVYLTTGSSGNGMNKTITLKTTSGTKKIFVAANVKANPMTTQMVETTGLGILSSDFNISFANLNAPLYSIATGFSVTAPTVALYADVADGLIKNFAMSDINNIGRTGANQGEYSTGATHSPFMTNWDGPNDTGAGATTHPSTAEFTLHPDIDSVASRPTFPGPTFDDAKNRFEIFVQRAYAKVSLKFGFAGTAQSAPSVPTGIIGKYYNAAVGGGGAEGRFFPWGAGTVGSWSLGNITTAELPFQQYNNGVVQDMFFQNTTDSMKAGHFTNWFLHYDNTRVFPFSATINTYPNAGILVSNTKSRMAEAGNFVGVTADNETTQANYSYAYATENARLNPVAHDHAAYVVIGGFYQPKTVLTNIVRAMVPTNNPTYGVNGGVILGTEPAGSTVSGLDFSYTQTANDSLYYLADDKIFIKGKNNLLGYYAWSSTRKANIYAGNAWQALNPGVLISATVPAVTTELAADVDVIAAINEDIRKKVLFAFFEGQCFYRIFIQNDKSASTADRVAVLRNHIYDISITSIKGPGIADPNEILIPDKPVLEQDTYVSATITVLDWHKVDQAKDVDNQ
jgi:hypothetical protein